MEPAGQDDESHPLPAQRTPVKRRLALAALVALALVCAAVAGVWLYASEPQLTSSVDPPADSVDPAIAAEGKPPLPASPQPAAPIEDSAMLAARMTEVDQLREILQAKKDQILQAQQDYRYGILELEDEARRLFKHARIDSLAQALKCNEVEALLRSIQRRQVYWEALDKPLGWIESASESLLYLNRRAAMDLLLKDVAAGIDIKKHVHAIDQALEGCQPTPERLGVDPGSIAPPSLEVITKRLVEQAKSPGGLPGDRRGQEIEAEVCSGNLSRAAELSTLSLKGARCLAESEAKQLFLTRLAEMTPPVAEALSKWPGEWLCANAVARLDPEAAAHLFAWRGEWLSLNGLGELPAEAGKHLAGWSGRQLELMGLRKTAGAGYLAQWEAQGGRLFVPDVIRSAIDQAGRK
jgi:hypothetical protein